MKVEASNIEELIDNSFNPELVQEIKNLVESHSNSKPVFVSTASINMVGYYFFEYKNSTFDGKLWPAISIAPQKNFVGLYIFTIKDGKYFLEEYADNFKKSELGKSCLRIKKLDENNIDIITEIVVDAISHVEKNVECVEVK